MAEWFELDELPIRLNARGEWFHGDRELHPRVAQLFARNLVPQADGTYQIVLGFNRQVVVVEDAAFFVRSVSCVPEDGPLERVEMLVSDERTEVLDPATLIQSPSNVLYAQIERGGRQVPCRFSPATYHTLALHFEMDDVGAYVMMGQQRYRIG
jgi:hypothetical protein